MTTEWVTLGQVIHPHGVRGEVRIRLHNPDSNSLEGRQRLWLRRGDERREVGVARLRPVPGAGIIVQLSGIEDRTSAESLRGMLVELPREELPSADEDEFYVVDLVGIEVVGPHGRLGTVETVQTYPSTDVLVVRRVLPRGDLVEVPLVDDFVDQIDLSGRKVLLREAALEFFDP